MLSCLRFFINFNLNISYFYQKLSTHFLFIINKVYYRCINDKNITVYNIYVTFKKMFVNSLFVQVKLQKQFLYHDLS